MKFLLYLEPQLLRTFQCEDPRTHPIKGKNAGTTSEKPHSDIPAWMVWIWEHKDGQPQSIALLQSTDSKEKGFPELPHSLKNAVPQVFLLERPADPDFLDNPDWPSGMKPSDHQILLVLQSKGPIARLTLVRGRKQLQLAEETTPADILKAIKTELHLAAMYSRDLRRTARHRAHQEEETFLAHSFTHLIEQQFHDSQCNIPHLAKMLGISGSRLQRICQQHHGMGPKAFLVQYRIQKSCEFIRKIPEQRRCVMSKIAQASGFSSSSYFSYIFLNQMGMTPTEYRYQELLSNSFEQ